MPAPKPLLREFMGLNGHTVNFKPDLYRPTCRLVRDYHNVSWDVGEDGTAAAPAFPMSKNGIDWDKLYSGWTRLGWEIDVCSQFSKPPSYWTDIKKDPYAYGRALAKFAGPSGRKLATSVEIGNEPGNYPDDVYRTLFESMARGLRDGDPRLKIVTCATFAKPSGSYHKSVTCFQGLEALYDVLNVHSYAQAEGYPTWRRSYPEDPKLAYLKDIQDVIDWRDRSARGKRIYLTEFGYDSTTKPNETTGDFKNWMGVTDTQQARYIVRSFLVFSAMDFDRAYLYFFDDDDKPSVHAASGLTRHFQPKPSYYAMSHLFSTLGDYRFERAVRKDAGDVYVYEYRHGRDPASRVWAVWSPTGSERRTTVTLTGLPGRIEKAEQMPLAPGAARPVRVDGPASNGTFRVDASESPVYLWLRGGGR